MALRYAFLVLGPESSGTRMWTRVLMACGCYGDAGHQQRIDELGFPELGGRLLVWRRSLPHGGKWPDLGGMARKLREAKYAPHALVCTRDWWATIQSQIRNGHEETKERAEANIRRAYGHALQGLRAAGVPYTLVSYEALVQRGPEMIEKLLPGWHLEPPERWAEEYFDGNEKHYRSAQ